MVCSTKFLEVQKTDTQWCRSELFLRELCISVCLGACSATNWKSVERVGTAEKINVCSLSPHPGHSAETLSDQSKQNPTETLLSPTWSVLSPDISEEVLQHSYQNSKILQLVPFLLYSEPGRYFCCNVQCLCIEGMTKVSQSSFC